MIRYNETIARTPVQNVYVEDGNGRIWNADQVEKSDDRKRFITIRGLSENTAVPVVPDTPVDPDDPLDPVNPTRLTWADFALADTVQVGHSPIRFAR